MKLQHFLIFCVLLSVTVATPIPGLINALGIAGNANSNKDNSENHNVSAGNNQQFSGDGNSNTATATLAGLSVDQSIHG